MRRLGFQEGPSIGYERPRVKPRSPDCQSYGQYVLHFSVLLGMREGKSRKETQGDVTSLSQDWPKPVLFPVHCGAIS